MWSSPIENDPGFPKLFMAYNKEALYSVSVIVFSPV